MKYSYFILLSLILCVVVSSKKSRTHSKHIENPLVKKSVKSMTYEEKVEVCNQVLKELNGRLKFLENKLANTENKEQHAILPPKIRKLRIRIKRIEATLDTLVKVKKDYDALNEDLEKIKRKLN